MSFQQILDRGLVRYQQRDRTSRDVNNLIRQYSDLRPKTGQFEMREILCLEGTIPVNYRGSTYNIPVGLWLMESYPNNPPAVYVRPTNTMEIKPSQNVDPRGKVMIAYLREWKPSQSDLLSLVQILSIVFGEDCPVFSRQTPLNQQPPPQWGGYPSQPQNRLPYPMQGGAAPGYNSMGMPAPNKPAYPPQGYPPTSSGYPPSSNYGGVSQPSSYPYPQQGSYPYPGQQRTAAETVTSASTASQLPNSQALTDEQIRASLISACEDKMRRRLREVGGQLQAEVDCLKVTEENLNKGKAKLEDMISRLEKEQEEVDRNIRILSEKNTEITNSLQKMDVNDEVNVDEAVMTPAPLYRQLLNSFAEEQAIDDAIYCLGEALRKEVIDLDVFLKQVRELSRRQFMLRALITKCRQKAGLPEVAST